MLFSWDGLVVRSPVVLLCVIGLVLLWRSGFRSAATVCGVVSALFLVLDAGYFDPFGGVSPGPRFFVPALPFLALGLACSYRRWPIPVLVVAAISIAAMLYTAGTWFVPYELSFQTTWSLAGAPRWIGGIVAAIGASAALAVAARSDTRRSRPSVT